MSPPPSAPGTKIVGADWSCDDLTGRVLDGVEYVRLDLAESTSTSGLSFDACVFRDAGFNLARHSGAAFVNCTFTGCAFFGATFTDCKFVGSRFERCTFDQVTVNGGDWSFTSLRGADLHTARIEGARLRDADLTGANLVLAALRTCDLTGAVLHNARLDRCDLRGSDLSAIDPWTVSLRAAIITWEQAAVLASAMGLDVRPE